MSDFFHQHSMFFNGTTTKQNIAPRNVNLPTASLQLLQRPLKCPNNLCLPIRREYTGSLPTKNMLEPLCGKTIERTSPKIEQWINRKPMVYRDDKLPIDIGSMGRLYIYLYIWLIFVNPMVSLKECNKKTFFFGYRIPQPTTSGKFPYEHTLVGSQHLPKPAFSHPKPAEFFVFCSVFRLVSKTLVVRNISHTLQGINVSHLGKRKIIFKMPFLGIC